MWYKSFSDVKHIHKLVEKPRDMNGKRVIKKPLLYGPSGHSVPVGG